MDFTRQRSRRLRGEPGYTAIQTARRTSPCRCAAWRARTRTSSSTWAGGTPPASARPRVADTLLVPFAPTSVDLWTVEPSWPCCRRPERSQPCAASLPPSSQGVRRGSDKSGAARWLREYSAQWTLDAPIGTRKASQCLRRRYPSPSINRRDAKAIAEMMVLYRYLFDMNTYHKTYYDI